MDVEDTIKKIIEQTGLTREEIKVKIEKEITDLHGLIDEESALLIVLKRLGLSLENNQQTTQFVPDAEIKDLKKDMNISVVGKIVDIFDLRTFNKKDGTSGKFFSFIIQDQTGQIRIITWNGTEIYKETGFAKGELVRIVNGAVKVNEKTQTLEIHVGNKSRIQLNPDNVDLKKIIEDKSKTSEFIPLSKVNLNFFEVNVKGFVNDVFPAKEFNKKTGEIGKRSSILLKDSETSLYITFWNQDVEKMKDIKVGDEIEIYKVYPKKNFRDPTKIDLNTGNNTELKIISHQKQENDVEKIEKIQNLIEKGGSGTIEGVIQDIENVRSVKLKDGTIKDIQSFYIADETGSIRVNLWGETIIPDLIINDTLKIINAYTRKNNFSNQFELSLSKNGSITRINKKITPVKFEGVANPEKNKETISPNEPKITERISTINSNKDYLIRGVIIRDLKRITIYDACPSCNKKKSNCTCKSNEPAVPRIILNAIIDDESGSIRVTWIGDLAEKILQEKAARLKEIMDHGEIDNYLKLKSRELVGKEFEFITRAKYSQYNNNYELNINSYKEIDPERINSELIKTLN